MENIKKELTFLGFDPSLLSQDDLLDLKKIIGELRHGENEHLTAFLRKRETLEKAHDAFLDALDALAEKTEIDLLAIAKLPSSPTRGFSAACVKMLTDIFEAKETSLSDLLLSLGGLREELAQGEKDRLVLEKEHSVLSLALRLCRDSDSALSPIDASLFGNPLKAIFFDFSIILGDCEAFLSSFALCAARIAKKIDKGEASPTEYGRLMEGARIRLHDLSVQARHIRKETDHVKIHTRP